MQKLSKLIPQHLMISTSFVVAAVLLTACGGSGTPTSSSTSSEQSVVASTSSVRSSSVSSSVQSSASSIRSSSSSSAASVAGGDNTMGFIGCSMGENTATGYRAIGGKKMWGPYGTNGDVVQNWTNNTSPAWKKFDQQVTKYGKPTEVWVQICIFNNNVNITEVKQLIANARSHAAPNAKIYVTGQPLYATGLTCDLAGAGGPEKTDRLAKEAADDTNLNVIYPGSFGPLTSGDRTDSCHANTKGQQLLGEQAARFWGK